MEVAIFNEGEEGDKVEVRESGWYVQDRLIRGMKEDDKFKKFIWSDIFKIKKQKNKKINEIKTKQNN